IEKPFTSTLEQAEEIFKLAKEQQLVAAVFQNRRYDADFLTIKKMIQEKTLGDIVSIESHFDRFRMKPKENSWREQVDPQGGVWWDLGPHLLDQAVVLMGKPKRVECDIGTQREALVDDFFDTTFYYDHG